MSEAVIRQISELTFGTPPLSIAKKTIGICNEVYELTTPDASYIVRMNQQPDILRGTAKFLPLFKRLGILTPDIIAEDYSKSIVPCCYQIQSKIEGNDLILVFDQLSQAELSSIAKEVSDIFDKFNGLPPVVGFGEYSGRADDQIKSLHEDFMGARQHMAEGTKASGVIDQPTFQILDELLETFGPYLKSIQPRLYYDDICCKNIMIHEGRFNGLVDLDFLRKGDYLEAIGTILAAYFGKPNGKFYLDEVIRHQKLDPFQREVVYFYGIKQMTGWLSEAGVQHNSNTSSTINWEEVHRKRKVIQEMYQEMKNEQ